METDTDVGKSSGSEQAFLPEEETHLNSSSLQVTVIKKLSLFCKKLSLSRLVQQRAIHFLQDINDVVDGTSKEDERGLFASVVYMALIDTRFPYGPSDPLLERGSLEPPSITVTDVLMGADININKLFTMMNAISSTNYMLSKAIKNHLTLMGRNYCVVSALFHSFENRLCPTVFRDENKNDNPDFIPAIPASEGVAFRKKQCWLLFLLSKYHLLPDSQSLCQHFQLLLCGLEFVLRQTPSFLLSAPYDSIRIGCYTREQGVTMIEKLAVDFQVSVDETIQLHEERTEPYFQKLLNKDGELDSDRLCDEYGKIYHEGDLNELLFLSGDPHLLPTQASRVVSPTDVQTNLLPEQMTPVRVAVNNVHHLLQNFADLPEEPSDKLESYFKRCTQNPGEHLTNNLSNLKDKFLESYLAVAGTFSQPSVAEQRFKLGVKIYLKVLETILDTESDKLPQQVLTTLLNKENFHKALLACALEVVITTYEQTWNQGSGELSLEAVPFSFPWILEVLPLQAFDFYKVIETFISAEPKLPRDVVKHLQCLEFEVLSSLAWKEDSSLFETLGHWDMGQMTPPIAASPMKYQESMNDSPHGSSAIDHFLSPVRPSQQPSISGISTLPSLLLVPSSSSLPSAESEINDPNVCKLSAPAKSKSLSHFLKRVCKLGFCRLTKLCSQLSVSENLQHKIWTCFEYCVNKMSTLIMNRHIDQIIMCCIYAICKVSEQEIRFKAIVNEYRNLTHAKQEVVKDVYMEKGTHNSIINFYNDIFMKKLKNYIYNFSPNKLIKPLLSPMLRQPPASPSYTLPGKSNFIISPMKVSPFKAVPSPTHMTPRTRLLYSFGESINSSETFRTINEKMNEQRSGGLASAKKRLNLDEITPPGTNTKVRKVLL